LIALTWSTWTQLFSLLCDRRCSPRLLVDCHYCVRVSSDQSDESAAPSIREPCGLLTRPSLNLDHASPGFRNAASATMKYAAARAAAIRRRHENFGYSICRYQPVAGSIDCQAIMLIYMNSSLSPHTENELCSWSGILWWDYALEVHLIETRGTNI
jgi:hypothetical protein